MKLRNLRRHGSRRVPTVAIGGSSRPTAARCKPGDRVRRHRRAPRPTARVSSRQALAAGAAAIVAERGREPLPRRRRVRAGRQCAARAGAGGGEILSAPAGNHRGRDRHQRQNLGRGLHAPDLDGARPSRPPASAPSAWSRRRGEIYGSLTTPDPVDAASHARSSSPARASLIWRSRRPRTASISTGSTACASRPAASPISRRDHLDYHPTFEAYLAAKLRLFERSGRAGRHRGDRRRSRACRRGGRGRDSARPAS